LWSSNKKTKRIQIEPIQCAKVPVPHPGQSYNPQREDLRNLLQNIVEIRKPKVDINEKECDNDKLGLKEGKFEESESEIESEEEPVISNNPAVDDSNRLTRRIKNKIHTSKLNKLKEVEAKRKKEQKTVINNIKKYERFDKEVRKTQKQEQETKTKLEGLQEKQKKLLKMGVDFDDTDNLDFKINKKGASVSLKNLNTERNLISDQFENIVKRNVLGEVNQLKKKKNQKLHKMHYKDNGDHYFDEVETGLKIFN